MQTATQTPASPLVRGRVPKLTPFLTAYLNKVAPKSQVPLKNRLTSADLTGAIDTLSALRNEINVREVAEAQVAADKAAAELAAKTAAAANVAPVPAPVA